MILFLVDGTYTERDKLAPLIVLTGGTKLNITEGAPENLPGVTIVVSTRCTVLP